MSAPQGDPTSPGPNPGRVAPRVRRPQSGVPLAVYGGIVVAAALLLFLALDAHRKTLTAPPIGANAEDMTQAPRSGPALFIPPEPTPVESEAPTTDTPTTEAKAPPQPPSPPTPPPVYAAPVYSYYRPPPPPPPATLSNTPALAYDTTVAAKMTADGSDDRTGATRVRAAPIRHRETTVTQGTMIPAVLETALDSARAGFARALVSRDVRGFDGSTVLIPRGSRLTGDYKTDVSPGQNRIVVTWTRLVRPDGVAIALGSPSTDMLGRVGIKGKVDSHFLARFGGAILQSALDIAVNAATTPVKGTVLNLGGSGRTDAGSQGAQAVPTIRIRQGVRIAVFVARDLDFTSVERQP